MDESYKYNEVLTVKRLKEKLEDYPDHVPIQVTNSNGEMTMNIELWFEDEDTRQFIEMMGHKPYRQMNDDELRKCNMK